jgi:hypothetical protein
MGHEINDARDYGEHLRARIDDVRLLVVGPLGRRFLGLMRDFERFQASGQLRVLQELIEHPQMVDASGA